MNAKIKKSVSVLLLSTIAFSSGLAGLIGLAMMAGINNPAEAATSTCPNQNTQLIFWGNNYNAIDPKTGEKYVDYKNPNQIAGITYDLGSININIGNVVPKKLSGTIVNATNTFYEYNSNPNNTTWGKAEVSTGKEFKITDSNTVGQTKGSFRIRTNCSTTNAIILRWEVLPISYTFSPAPTQTPTPILTTAPTATPVVTSTPIITTAPTATPSVTVTPVITIAPTQTPSPVPSANITTINFDRTQIFDNADLGKVKFSVGVNSSKNVDYYFTKCSLKNNALLDNSGVIIDDTITSAISGINSDGSLVSKVFFGEIALTSGYFSSSKVLSVVCFPGQNSVINNLSPVYIGSISLITTKLV